MTRRPTVYLSKDCHDKRQSQRPSVGFMQWRSKLFIFLAKRTGAWQPFSPVNIILSTSGFPPNVWAQEFGEVPPFFFFFWHSTGRICRELATAILPTTRKKKARGGNKSCPVCGHGNVVGYSTWQWRQQVKVTLAFTNKLWLDTFLELCHAYSYATSCILA